MVSINCYFSCAFGSVVYHLPEVLKKTATFVSKSVFLSVLKDSKWFLFSKKVTFWKAGMWRILYFSDTFRLKIVGSVSEKFFLLLLDHWGPNGGFSENLRKQILERKRREATSMECFFSSPQIDFESKYNWFFMKDTECKSKNTNDITILNE